MAGSGTFRCCASRDELFRDPHRCWVSFGSGVFWCLDPTLCGFVVWGRPSLDDTRALTRILDGHQHLAPRFDVVQDGRLIEAVDGDALAHLLEWLRANGGIFDDHVARRIAVLPVGAPGLTLLGIQPLLELGGPLTIVTDAGEGFRALRPDDGDEVLAEVDAAVHAARATPAPLLALRAALAAAHGDLELAAAARRIGVSSRTLQRVLADAGVSFRSEQADARFRVAVELLQGDDKVVAVAARLGLSEDGLTNLVRARTGLTPGELRRRRTE